MLVDLFAGGGGASTGIELALGVSPDVAINHDAEALAMHEANHGSTLHLHGDVWHYAPQTVTQGRPVELLWLSPDCTHFSKAKGGKPLSRKRRALATVAIRWARDVRPDVICLENVEEWQHWGPLTADLRPCPRRKGKCFRSWVSKLRALGYAVEWRELRACDYGAPTTRKRLFVIARCDGRPLVWPTPTHGPGRIPHRTAAECIDWSIPVPSIFDRKKPLAEKTLARIARGIRRFVLDNPRPFIVPTAHAGDLRVHSIDEPLRTITASRRGDHALVAPTLIQTGYGEREGQAPRILDLHQPLGTVVAGGQKHGLVAAFLARHYGGHENDGADLRCPMATITTKDHHAIVTAHLGARREQVRAFLTQHNGTSVGVDAQLPLGVVTAGGWKHGVVTVHGVDYEIADIGMRMLSPRELFRAQGFPDSYVIDPGGMTKTAQIRMCGNSVAPQVVAAIIGANMPRSRKAAA